MELITEMTGNLIRVLWWQINYNLHIWESFIVGFIPTEFDYRNQTWIHAKFQHNIMAVITIAQIDVILNVVFTIYVWFKFHQFRFIYF